MISQLMEWFLVGARMENQHVHTACHNPIFDHFILIIIIIILFTEKDKKNDDKKIMMIKKQVK